MVSLLSLKNTMIMVFSGDETANMMILSEVSGAVITISLIILSIVTIAQRVKNKKVM